MAVATMASFALLASPAAGYSLLGPGAAGKGGMVVRFSARGTHGYAVSVYAPVGPRSPVAITVEDRRGAAQYVASGTVTRSRVRASFGRLGRISLRFRPSGTVLRNRLLGGSECPDGAAARVGTFVGVFEFRGESGYTKVAAHKVEGGVGAPTAPFDELETKQFGCHQEQHLAEPVLPATPRPSQPTEGEAVAGTLNLFAGAVTATGTIHLLAGPLLENGAPTRPPTTLVVALLQEEVEGVRIGRMALGGGETSQVFPGNPTPATGATLTPGAPFRGSAGYTPGVAGAGTLTGDLGVPMPGAGTVSLTGPSFAAELLRPET